MPQRADSAAAQRMLSSPGHVSGAPWEARDPATQVPLQEFLKHRGNGHKFMPSIGTVEVMAQTCNASFTKGSEFTNWDVSVPPPPDLCADGSTVRSEKRSQELVELLHLPSLVAWMAPATGQ